MNDYSKTTIASYNKIAKEYADTRTASFWLDEYKEFKKRVFSKVSG